jgi:uncharacterized protein with FMN-binding domain
MRKYKKSMIWTAIAVLLIGMIWGGKYALDLSYYKDTMAKVEIGDIDLSKVKDGTYEGSYDARIISAAVSVTVKDGKITDVRLLEHKNDRGGSAEAIVDDILKEQSLDVDVVSGATNSSMTILKAVENALNSDPVE